MISPPNLVSFGASARNSTRSHAAFSLIELLTVMAIIAMMTGLLIPAISNQKNAGDVTMAAHTVANVLESARSYARANNVYVWVGFFEEDASSSTSGVKGNGRVIVSVVASKDGTSIYDSDNVSAATSLDPARLVQLNRLYKINNLHLKTFSDGSGTGSTFDTRPTVGTTKAQIGDTTPNASTIPFQYPVGAGATATYKFDKVIQFNPRGEIRVASLDSGDTEFAMHPIVEIGLQPTHGAVIDASTPNTSAVQITGIAGNVAIYRK